MYTGMKIDRNLVLNCVMRATLQSVNEHDAKIHSLSEEDSGGFPGYTRVSFSLY